MDEWLSLISKLRAAESQLRLSQTPGRDTALSPEERVEMLRYFRATA